MTTIYLDVDGVLLRRSCVSRGGFELSPGAEAFLAYLVESFDVCWLTTRCKHGLPNDITRAFRHAMQVTDLPPKLTELINLVKPTQWNACKTEGIDLSTDFYWIDDNPTREALQVLAQHGCEHRWIEARVDHDPADLLRVHDVLDERLSASSGASRAATDQNINWIDLAVPDPLHREPMRKQT
jgi:hypothetical protein